MTASFASLVPQTIQRDIPIPLHYQLSELLHQEIKLGRWQVGDRIPTEEELCSHFSLSRTTVRKALDVLVNAGYLRREKARGTFVARPKVVEGLVDRPVGFFEDMATRGIPVCTPTVEMQRIRPPEAIAKELQLGPDATVIKIDRVRCIESDPILIVTSYLPYDLCPGVMQEDLSNTGLYTLLEQKYGLRIVRAKRFVESVAANDYEAQLLGVKRGSPLMLIESTVYLDDGRPIEYFKARHRGDRTRLIVETFRYDDKEKRGAEFERPS